MRNIQCTVSEPNIFCSICVLLISDITDFLRFTACKLCSFAKKFRKVTTYVEGFEMSVN